MVAGWCGRVLAVGVVLWYGARPLAEGSPDLFGIGLALVMGWILWSGASAALRRAPLERLLLRVRPEDVMQTVAVVPALTPVGEHRRHRAAGRGARRARPADPPPARAISDTAPDIATLPPSTRLASVVVKVPDECVVSAPGADAEPVLRAMATTGWGVVIVTSAGEVRGLVTSDRLNAVAEAVLGRN